MHVRVCIVAFRNEALIAACLEALSRSTHADFSVVVIENGGTAAWERLVTAIPERLPGGQGVAARDAGGNLGYAGGVNAAIADPGPDDAPAPDAYWVLNPDTLPDPDALGHMVAALAAGRGEVIGSTLLASDGSVQNRGGRWRAPLARAVSLDKGKAPGDASDPRVAAGDLSYVSGASMLIARTAAERVGPWRHEYFLYAEEVEWCLRARATGVRFATAPDALVRHDQGATTGSGGAVATRSRLSIHLDERNKLLVVRDTTPGWLVTAIPASLALLTLRYGRNRAAWRWSLAGWWDGVRGRRGVPDWVGG